MSFINLINESIKYIREDGYYIAYTSLGKYEVYNTDMVDYIFDIVPTIAKASEDIANSIKSSYMKELDTIEVRHYGLGYSRYNNEPIEGVPFSNYYEIASELLEKEYTKSSIDVYFEGGHARTDARRDAYDNSAKNITSFDVRGFDISTDGNEYCHLYVSLKEFEKDKDLYDILKEKIYKYEDLSVGDDEDFDDDIDMYEVLVYIDCDILMWDFKKEWNESYYNNKLSYRDLELEDKLKSISLKYKHSLMR